ncbi:MAG: ATP-binding protein [Lentimicrobiaceae bacterium]|nr:ATP-binding protein [Lentimicrobiaceae bacterium]
MLAISQINAQTIPERILQYEQEISEGKVDEIKMLKNYIDLITFYSHIDIAKTHLYFREAIAYSQEKKQLDWESAYWRRLAQVYYELGKIDSSYYCIDKAITLVEDKGYDYEQCANYQTQGVAFFMGQEYEKSLNAYLKALELNNKDKAQKIAMHENVHNNLGIEASIYRHISRIYSKLLNYDNAIDYLLRAKKIMDDNPTDRIALVLLEIETLGELADLYMTTRQPEKALPLLKKCYELAVAKEFLPEMVFGLCRLSNFYCSERQDFKQALAFSKEALQIAEKTEMPYLISNAERNMMKVYFGLKDYQSACRYAERALSKAEEGDWDHLQDLYGHLIMIHALLGNVSQSELYLTKYNEITANLSDKNLHNSLQEMEVKYDVQQKQFKIERQQTEIKQYRTQQFIFIGGISAAGLLLALLVVIVIMRSRRNRALAEMNAIKDKFFSIISHDLKNPALAQREALQLLSENAPQWDIHTISNYHRQLLKSANGLVDLLSNLLNWAQIQTGRENYHPLSFNLVTALQPDLEVVKNLATRKEITFEALMPQTLIITGDENMLLTVVRNLLTNAVKFTMAGGNVLLNINQCSDKYIISVTDTGIGMLPEQIQNLFRIDRQWSSSGTAGEHGTGLGLVVCKEMIEKHGSKLYIESEVGKGSRFWFELGRS